MGGFWGEYEKELEQEMENEEFWEKEGQMGDLDEMWASDDEKEKRKKKKKPKKGDNKPKLDLQEEKLEDLVENLDLKGAEEVKGDNDVKDDEQVKDNETPDIQSKQEEMVNKNSNSGKKKKRR